MPAAKYRPVADVAYVTARPERTIRNWARDQRIDSIKYRGELRVDLVAAYGLSLTAGRRNRQSPLEERSP